ncbi:hypothetical protein GCM10023097_77670 [Streptomyces collinus]
MTLFPRPQHERPSATFVADGRLVAQEEANRAVNALRARDHGTGSLAAQFPLIAQQWHPHRNGELTPTQLTAYTTCTDGSAKGASACSCLLHLKASEQPNSRGGSGAASIGTWRPWHSPMSVAGERMRVTQQSWQGAVSGPRLPQSCPATCQC